MYQHYTQRAYLERWKVNGYLFLFDKSGDLTKPESIQSAAKIFGIDDWQSVDQENAFAAVERAKGHTHHVGEITDAAKISILARWMALHAVRNGINAPDISKINYETEVDKLAARFEGHYGFFQDFAAESLITGDSPVVWVRHEKSPVDFYIAPAGPKRCVYLMPDDITFSHNGKPLFQADEINRLVFKNAARYCVSFDASLHQPS